MGIVPPEIATGPASNVWIATQLCVPSPAREHFWSAPHESVHAGMHAALHESSHPHDSPMPQPRLLQSGACVIVHDSICVCPHDVRIADVSGTKETATLGVTLLDPGECAAEGVLGPCAR